MRAVSTMQVCMCKWWGVGVAKAEDGPCSPPKHDKGLWHQLVDIENQKSSYDYPTKDISEFLAS